MKILKTSLILFLGLLLTDTISAQTASAATAPACRTSCLPISNVNKKEATTTAATSLSKGAASVVKPLASIRAIFVSQSRPAPRAMGVAAPAKNVSNQCDATQCDPAQCNPAPCDPSKCDPAQCDLTKCDPAQCKPVNCLKVAKME